MNIPEIESARRETLKRLLFDAGQFHARQAMTGFASEDQNLLIQAGVSVGSSVELLTKSYLASVEPALLASRGDRDSILVLTGKSHLAPDSSPTKIKSISATESLGIARHLNSQLPGNPNLDAEFFAVRNAAVHLALCHRTDLTKAIETMCRIVETLLVPLGVDRRDFWGPEIITVVDQVIDRASNEIRRSVTAKVAAATQRLAVLTHDLNRVDRTVVLSSLSGRRKDSGEHNEIHECPVCEQQGWLLCGVDSGPVIYDRESGEYDTLDLTRVAIPLKFECPVCELELEGDELLEFEFPREIELEPNEDPWDDREDF